MLKNKAYLIFKKSLKFLEYLFIGLTFVTFGIIIGAKEIPSYTRILSIINLVGIIATILLQVIFNILDMKVWSKLHNEFGSYVLENEGMKAYYGRELWHILDNPNNFNFAKVDLQIDNSELLQIDKEFLNKCQLANFIRSNKTKKQTISVGVVDNEIKIVMVNDGICSYIIK